MTGRRLIALVLLAAASPGCSGSRNGTETGVRAGGERGAAVAKRPIDDVLAAHGDSLLALPGVVGTAIGLCEGEQCIKVFLADSSPVARKRIPDHLEGYGVVVEVTGIIRPR